MSFSDRMRSLVLVELELGAGVLGEEDLVADLHVEGDPRPVLVAASLAGGDDRAPHRLLLGRVGQHDAALRHLLARHGLGDDPIGERSQCDGDSPPGAERDHDRGNS